jgi:DNA-directed RNA polymerase specialized sigma24 family protein
MTLSWQPARRRISGSSRISSVRSRASGTREREIIALRFGGELSGPEIAELTGLSLANVQQILSRSHGACAP